MKSAIRLISEDRIKKEMIGYFKLKEIGASKEGLELKDYVKKMSLRDSRTRFRIRSCMNNVKMNRKSDNSFANTLWKCDYCKSLDSQSHILRCSAFSPLREGKSLDCDKDFVKYFQDVMRIRDEHQC